MGRFPRPGPNLHSLPSKTDGADGGDGKVAVADTKNVNLPAGSASTFVLADAAAGVASATNVNSTSKDGTRVDKASTKPTEESAAKKEEVRDKCEDILRLCIPMQRVDK